MTRTNLRRITKAEVSAIADILAEEADDIEELAKTILRAINLHRSQEEHWVRVVRHGSGYLMYGPYRSAEAARDDHQSRGPAKSPEPPDVRLWSLLPPFGQGTE
jgi:hypothetical protein